MKKQIQQNFFLIGTPPVYVRCFWVLNIRFTT